MSRRPFGLSGASQFYVFDLQGNTRGLGEPGAGLTDRYSFKAFGEEMASSGASANPYRFCGSAGYYRDLATRLYVRARHLQPGVGRWMSRDPLHLVLPVPAQLNPSPAIGIRGPSIVGDAAVDHDANLYVYVGNNALSRTDPLGLSGSNPGGAYHPPIGVRPGCRRGDYCEDIRGKIWLLRRMIRSHEGWDRRMPRPRGGNRHADEIADLYRALANCQQLLLNCQPRPRPAPVPVPCRAPARQPGRVPALTPGPIPWYRNVNWGLVGVGAVVVIGVGVLIVVSGGTGTVVVVAAAA